MSPCIDALVSRPDRREMGWVRGGLPSVDRCQIDRSSRFRMDVPVAHPAGSLGWAATACTSASSHGKNGKDDSTAVEFRGVGGLPESPVRISARDPPEALEVPGSSELHRAGAFRRLKPSEVRRIAVRWPVHLQVDDELHVIPFSPRPLCCPPVSPCSGRRAAAAEVDGADSHEARRSLASEQAACPRSSGWPMVPIEWSARP